MLSRPMIDGVERSVSTRGPTAAAAICTILTVLLVGACEDGRSLNSVVCGNDVCEKGETYSSCPEDCDLGCGDEVCDSGESYETCPSDCPTPCGDGVCGSGESSTSCPEDCGAVCGDGLCNGDETGFSCPYDCHICGDGMCSAQETPVTCPEDCKGDCGDGQCTGDETVASCRVDCRLCDSSSPGCCEGDLLNYCDNGTFRSRSCGYQGCGWSINEGRYNCGFTGEDPTGHYPIACGCQQTKANGVFKIYHGTADPEFCLTPGQVLAVGALVDPDGENFCTATLVSEDVVITAAHCVMDYWGNPVSPSSVFFAVGTDISSPVHTFSVQSVFRHSQYEWYAEHDMGVLVLTQSAVAVLPEIQPIPINRQALSSAFVNQVVQNVGYGSTHNDPDNTRRWWTTEPVTELLSGEYVVYGNSWSSVCYGDSGGPSIYMFNDRVARVVGTVSWGDSSCMDYDHFCRVDDNVNFIDPRIGLWDECMGLDVAGWCNGDIAQWCENATLNQQCCENGCGLDTNGLYRCNDADPCQGITEKGICRGDLLIWCREGEIYGKYCSMCGLGRCDWTEETGAFCNNESPPL